MRELDKTKGLDPGRLKTLCDLYRTIIIDSSWGVCVYHCDSQDKLLHNFTMSLQKHAHDEIHE